jgi:outer membrane protein OmpA-like peptidoglycan-associated protein
MKCFIIIFLHLISCNLFAQDELNLRKDSIIITTRTIQDKSSFRYGILGGISSIQNTSSLSIVPGATDCGYLTGGNAQGTFGGIHADYFVLDDYISLSGRILYASRPATLTAETSNYLVLNQDLQYSPLTIEHNFTTELEYIIADLGINFQPFQNFPVYCRTSFDIGDSQIKNSYLQYEKILSPINVLFPNNTKIRVTGTGSLETALSYGVNIAVGAYIEFQPSLYINPEIHVRKGLNSILQNDQSWTISSVDASIGIMYRYHSSVEIIDTQYINNVPLIPPPTPIVNLIPPVAIGTISSNPLSIQETIVTQTFPLLPYIFFDSISTEVTSRYLIDNRSFTESNLSKETLKTYYNMINIIANRMKLYPQSSILLTGTTDGKELSSIAKRNQLALQRAESIKNILVSQFLIDSKRIAVKYRDVPVSSSSDKYPEGIEENRRVEISSENIELLQPVIHTKFQEFAPIYKTQMFKTSVDTPSIVQSWRLDISYKGQAISSINNNGIPPEQLEIELDSKDLIALGNSIDISDSLDASLTIKQDNDIEHVSTCKLAINKTMNQFEISRLSLIVFDFDQSDISDINKSMMKSFVRDALRPNSIATITGSTDRLGEIEYNEELSANRANTVRDYLKSIQPTINIGSTKGIGASLLPFDNNLAEGRYYCRTVSVEVKTPRQ